MIEWFLWLMFHPLGLMTYAGAMTLLFLTAAAVINFLRRGGR